MVKSVTSAVSLKTLVASMAERFALSRHDFTQLLSMRYGIGYNPAGDSTRIAKELGASPFVVRNLLSQAWKKSMADRPEYVGDVANVVRQMLNGKLLLPVSKVAGHPYFEGVQDPETALQNLIRDMASYADAVGTSFPRVIQAGTDAPMVFIPDALTSAVGVTDIAPKPYQGFIPGWATQVALAFPKEGQPTNILASLEIYCVAIQREKSTRSCSMLLDRVGRNGQEGLSLEEVGERHGVTRERARISCQDAVREIQMVEAAAADGPLTALNRALLKAFPNGLPPLISLNQIIACVPELACMKDNDAGLYNLMTAAGYHCLIRTGGYYINTLKLDKEYAVAILRSLESMANAADTKAIVRARPAKSRMSVTLTSKVINAAHEIKRSLDLSGESQLHAVNRVYAEVIGQYLEGKLEVVQGDLQPVEWDKRGDGWHMVHILLPKEQKVEFAKLANKLGTSRSSLACAILETHMGDYWKVAAVKEAA